MRFFSSSALAKAPKLILAANCSAAETIALRLSPAASAPLRRLASLGLRAGHYLVLRADKSIGRPAILPTPAQPMTQMLRRLAFVPLDRRQDLDRAAGLFDRCNRGLGGAVNLDIELGLDLAAAEQPHAVPGAAQHAGLHQRLRGDRLLGVDQLGVDRLLDPVEIDLDEFEAEDVGKAALRQPAMQRHLATLKALDAHARTRGLALAAAARGLAL